MIILVLNCGSSSIKYQVIDMNSATENNLLAKGLVERIGLTDGVLVHKPTDKPQYEFVKSIPDHTVGINMILSAIVDAQHGVIESLNDLNAVGHRVAHGGEYFVDSAIVTPTVKQQIESCFELAPLHNPANLKGILAIENLLPSIQQIAVFDTSFHQTMPRESYLYGIPYKYYEEYRIRKYGFHGTSHKFVAKKACDQLGLDLENSKIITCHIGNGASVTAILNGKSYNTSMGFTPVDGLLMGTRCGEVDPGALLYIADKEGLNANRISNLMNKESGLVGITGISSDMRDITKAASEGNERAKIAIKMFDKRVKKFIGAYAAEMGGVDLVIFTGGIGEHNRPFRKAVLENMEFLGIEFDEAANEEAYGIDKVITKAGSKVTAMAVTTNEELVIALDTFRLLRN
ncbi:MAG: acetate kinase [Rikenellaceae bacterium]